MTATQIQGRRWGRRLAAIALAAAGIAAPFLLPGDTASVLVAWLRTAGAAGVLVYVLAYAVGAICMVPSSLLMMSAGMAYGPIWGTLIASPASVVAATLAWFVGRTVARRRVARWAAADPRFEALDAAVADRGLQIVTLVRLSPLFPFTLLNLAFGVTTVRLRDYALGSLVGLLPVTVLYVYIGSVVGDLALGRGAAAAASPSRHALTAVGLAATIAVTVYVTRLARKALSRATGGASFGG
jgi:uncharacterized membrane protein YdjX (TVP38/TMEM64 family)